MLKLCKWLSCARKKSTTYKKDKHKNERRDHRPPLFGSILLHTQPHDLLPTAMHIRPTASARDAPTESSQNKTEPSSNPCSLVCMCMTQMRCVLCCIRGRFFPLADFVARVGVRCSFYLTLSSVPQQCANRRRK